MRFRQWLENDNLEKAASQAPASGEVIRSGLQPQVNSQEIKTHQKGHMDRIQAIDAHMERIRHATKGIGDESKQLKKVCDKMMEIWDGFKNAPADNVTPQVPEIQMQNGPSMMGMA